MSSSKSEAKVLTEGGELNAVAKESVPVDILPSNPISLCHRKEAVN